MAPIIITKEQESQLDQKIDPIPHLSEKNSSHSQNNFEENKKNVKETQTVNDTITLENREQSEVVADVTIEEKDTEQPTKDDTYQDPKEADSEKTSKETVKEEGKPDPEKKKKRENLIELLLKKPLPKLKDDAYYFYNKPPPALPKDLPPIPIRLSLEDDYPNRTIDHPDDMTNQEYRDRIQMLNNQWYFDEFYGLYRQHAPSNPNMSGSFSMTPTMKRLSRFSSSTPSSPLTFSTTNTSISAESWPTPKTIDQVHDLRKQARSLRDRKKQLDLCRILMDTACQGETQRVESPLPGTPPVNTRYTQDELRKKKKKKDLMLNQVLVLEAQKILKKLAMGNGGIGLGTDGEAQFLLANCYGVGGLGLRLDRERAFALYFHAAKQNHLESVYRVGCCYEIGLGTRQDHQRAIQFYKKAGSQSHAASMYKLAVIYMLGYCGQTVNMKESMTWLQRATSVANAQIPHALYCLAMFQLSIKQQDAHMVYDPTYALELLFESARLNYIPSQVKLGELYELGHLVEVDDALSIYWYTRAASQGSADAALALSSWYLTGADHILAQSDREAYLWARKATTAQHQADRWTIAKAYYLVGLYVENGIGISQNSTEDARIWFKRSAALGHLGALEILNQYT